jgi:protein-S-isoprenylcysteine O-methyltransferase Ste14
MAVRLWQIRCATESDALRLISGVLFLLVGIALALRSGPHAICAAICAGRNLLFIPLLEEPDLEQRFGQEYRVYRRAVPRFVPRMRPWSGSAPDNR